MAVGISSESVLCERDAHFSAVMLWGNKIDAFVSTYLFVVEISALFDLIFYFLYVITLLLYYH